MQRTRQQLLSEDIGTLFVEVLVASERRAMDLLFIGENERDESLLILNSVECSNTLGASAASTITEEVMSFILELKERAALTHLVLPTSYTVPSGTRHEPSFTAVDKIHPSGKSFYSDYLSHLGRGIVNSRRDNWTCWK